MLGVRNDKLLILTGYYLALIGHPIGEPLHQPLQILVIIRLFHDLPSFNTQRLFGLKACRIPILSIPTVVIKFNEQYMTSILWQVQQVLS